MNIRFLTLLLIVCTYWSCQSDQTGQNKAATLEGRWELVEGYRGGKKTESLEGTYFSFTEDKMSTNLPINGAIDSPFKLQENVISQTIVNNMSIEYTIVQLTEQDLQLATNLRGLDFLFFLKKKEEE